MKILYITAVGIPGYGAELKVSYAGLDTLLSQSDFISLHTPLSAETRHLISGRELSRMKKSAFLINTPADRWWMKRRCWKLAQRSDCGRRLDVYENDRF